MMKYSHDYDSFSFDKIENAIREFANQGSANLFVDSGIRFWAALDQAKCSFKAKHEAIT